MSWAHPALVHTAGPGQQGMGLRKRVWWQKDWREPPAHTGWQRCLFSAQFTAGLLASEGALMCPPPSPELGRSPRALCACPPITGPAVQCPPLPWGSVRPQGPASCAQRKQGRARPQLGKPPRGRPARVHWTGILSPQPRAQVERPQASWPERGVQDQNQASHSRKSPALHQWDLGHLGTKEDFQTSQTIFCFQLLNNSTV